MNFWNSRAGKMGTSKMGARAAICAAAVTLALGGPALANGASSGASPSAASSDYQPTVGQEGKDVVWVPTEQSLVNKMLDMAKLTPADILFDLGSGDGRTVITAAKRGATAFGVEYNPKMVALSKANAEKEGVSGKATFIHGDIFETDYSKANVLTMFLLPELNVRLRPTILKMAPGTRVVTNSFSMGDWQADQTESVNEDCRSYCTAYLWIVPAQVGGTWKLPQGELTLDQKYQVLSGSLKTGAGAADIADGKMNGDQIAFKVGDTLYSGKVVGNSIEGVAKTGDKEEKFQATRAN
jgi:SAM-dependent methyltransferase